MQKYYVNKYGIDAANTGSVHPAHRGGRDCNSHHIVRDRPCLKKDGSPRWGDGRPRAEINPETTFDYGDECSYKIGFLIPDDYSLDPSANAPVMNFHDRTLATGTPLTMNVGKGNIEITGTRINGDWFQAFEGFYIPEEWMDFEFRVKWTFNNDGYWRIWLYDTLIYSFDGATCPNDPAGPPFMKIGPQNAKWADGGNDGDAKYSRIFTTDLAIEQVNK